MSIQKSLYFCATFGYKSDDLVTNAPMKKGLLSPSTEVSDQSDHCLYSLKKEVLDILTGVKDEYNGDKKSVEKFITHIRQKNRSKIIRTKKPNEQSDLYQKIVVSHTKTYYIHLYALLTFNYLHTRYSHDHIFPRDLEAYFYYLSTDPYRLIKQIDHDQQKKID